MTFTHFINCSLLTFAPIYVIYSAKNLHEHRVSKSFLWVMIYFVIYNLVKMLLYATIIPYNTIESQDYNFSQEALIVVVNSIEIFFIILALNRKSSFIEAKESYLKVLTVSLSWSLSESFFSYFLYFLMNATNDEFNWQFIQSSVISNIDLFERIGIVAIVECYILLKKYNKFNHHLILLLLAKYSLNNFGYKYIPYLNKTGWGDIQARFSSCCIFVIICKLIYNNIIESIINTAANNYNTKKNN